MDKLLAAKRHPHMPDVAGRLAPENEVARLERVERNFFAPRIGDLQPSIARKQDAPVRIDHLDKPGAIIAKARPSTPSIGNA